MVVAEASVQNDDVEKLFFESSDAVQQAAAGLDRWAPRAGGRLDGDLEAGLPVRLVVVERDGPGSKLVTRRWVLEWTLAWLGSKRQVSKDYEGTIASSKAFVKPVLCHLKARRLE